MAEKKPIIRVVLNKFKEAGYRLSEEKWKELGDKDAKNIEEVGGKYIFVARCYWSDGEWEWFVVDEFPDIEALQKHVKLEEELELPRYLERKFYVGTPWAPMR